MREITAELHDRYSPWDTASAIALNTPGLTPLAPGQFVLLGGSDGLGPVIPVAVVPWTQTAGASLNLLFAESSQLRNFERMLRLDRPLHMRGPVGKGFIIDGRTRRALVVGNGEGLGTLLHLTAELLRRGLDITFVSTAEEPERHAPPGALPPEVEYLTPTPSRRLAQLEDLLPWADALYLAVSQRMFPDILTLLRRRLLRLPKGFAQALVRTIPMPCGIGACDLCMVETVAGYRRACRDGLVFDLQALI